MLSNTFGFTSPNRAEVAAAFPASGSFARQRQADTVEMLGSALPFSMSTSFWHPVVGEYVPSPTNSAVGLLYSSARAAPACAKHRGGDDRCAAEHRLLHDFRHDEIVILDERRIRGHRVGDLTVGHDVVAHLEFLGHDARHRLDGGRIDLVELLHPVENARQLLLEALGLRVADLDPARRAIRRTVASSTCMENPFEDNRGMRCDALLPASVARMQPGLPFLAREQAMAPLGGYRRANLRISRLINVKFVRDAARG